MSADDRGCESIATLLADATLELDATESHPDFADVIARAQRIAASRARLSIVEARRLDGLDSGDLEQVARIGDLEQLLASARADLGAVGDARQRAGAPPLRVDLPVRRHHGVIWAIALAIAAVVVAVISLDWRLQAHTMDPAARSEYSGASKTADGDEWSNARIDDTPRREPTGVSRTTLPPPAPLEFVIAKTPPAAVAKPRPTKAGPSITDRLVAADRDARAAWKRGDLRAAEAAFESIVQRGGRRSIVDLAYGDLFELARQRKDRAREMQLWRQYLRRFPNGRFADEALAGTCRRAAAAHARACWQRYLDERPHGTYRDNARAALGASAPARPR